MQYNKAYRISEWITFLHSLRENGSEIFYYLFLPFLTAERCSHESGKKLPNAFHLKFQSQTDVNQILL